jgi:hypothetical protein
MKEWLARRFSWMRHYRADIDLGDELKTHLEMQEEDYAALGISPSEARRRARLRLGSTPAIVENVRDLEFITLLEHAYHDFLFGLRALRKSPCLLANGDSDPGNRHRGQHDRVHAALWAFAPESSGERRGQPCSHRGRQPHQRSKPRKFSAVQTAS